MNEQCIIQISLIVILCLLVLYLIKNIYSSVQENFTSTIKQLPNSTLSSAKKKTVTKLIPISNVLSKTPVTTTIKPLVTTATPVSAPVQYLTQAESKIMQEQYQQELNGLGNNL